MWSSVLANELRHGLATYEKSGGYSPECPRLAIVKEDDSGHMYAHGLERSKENVSYEQVLQDPETAIVRVKEEPSYMCSNRSHPVGIAHVLIHTDYSKSGIPTIHCVLALPKEKNALTKTSSEVYAFFDTEDGEAHRYLIQTIGSALSAFENFDKDQFRSLEISDAICSNREGWSNDLGTKSEACSRYVSALVQRELDIITARNGGSHLTPLVSAVHGWDNYTWKDALATGEIDSKSLNGPPSCTPTILQDIKKRNVVSQAPRFPGISVHQQYIDPEAATLPSYEDSSWDASTGPAGITSTAISSNAIARLTTKNGGNMDTFDDGFAGSQEGSSSMAQPSSWTGHRVGREVSRNTHSRLSHSRAIDSTQPQTSGSERAKRILSKFLCHGREGSDSDD